MPMKGDENNNNSLLLTIMLKQNINKINIHEQYRQNN